MRLERHAAVIADDLPHIYASAARDDPAAAERVLDAVEARPQQFESFMWFMAHGICPASSSVNLAL